MGRVVLLAEFISAKKISLRELGRISRLETGRGRCDGIST